MRRLSDWIREIIGQVAAALCELLVAGAGVVYQVKNRGSQMFKRIFGPIVGAGFLFALSMVNVVEAGPPWYLTTAKLTRVGTGLTGEGFYLELDVVTHDNACHFRRSLFLPAGSPQYQDIVSTALLAFAQARPIDVFYDGSCWGDNVKLFAIAMRSTA